MDERIDHQSSASHMDVIDLLSDFDSELQESVVEGQHGQQVPATSNTVINLTSEPTSEPESDHEGSQIEHFDGERFDSENSDGKAAEVNGSSTGSDGGFGELDDNHAKDFNSKGAELKNLDEDDSERESEAFEDPGVCDYPKLALDVPIYRPYLEPEVFPSPPFNPEAQLQSFTVFPKLPIEIRRMIWRATFRPRRHVWSDEDSTLANIFCCERIKLTHPPIALSINKESREEVLRCYVKLDKSLENWNGYAHHRTPVVFFSMELDTLRLASSGTWYFNKFFDLHFANSWREILASIRYLEVEEGTCFEFDQPQPYEVCLNEYKGLKQLEFIPADWRYLTAECMAAFINSYNDYFAENAVNDPTRTIPKVVIGEPMRRGSMCDWLDEQ
ncbi:hypothetical protein V8E51_005060 [Hyaloscypha variabilis]